MIDWHSHILPGIDDGAADIEQSLLMGSALAAAGFTTVYCTPHMMRGCFDADNDQVRRGVVELQVHMDSRRIPLTLLPGREYCLDEYLLDFLGDPLPLGDSRSILVEIPLQTTPEMVRQLLYGVVRAGFDPVIAHPERCPLLAPVEPRLASRGVLGTLKDLLSGGARGRQQEAGEIDVTGNPLLDYLRDLGCSFQGNLGSFSGMYGRQVKAVAEMMKSCRLYDRYGSDLHAPEQAGLILGAVGSENR
jgi:protein-tyrosine phosphatase